MRSSSRTASVLVDARDDEDKVERIELRVAFDDAATVAMIMDDVENFLKHMQLRLLVAHRDCSFVVGRLLPPVDTLAQQPFTVKSLVSSYAELRHHIHSNSSQKALHTLPAHAVVAEFCAETSSLPGSDWEALSISVIPMIPLKVLRGPAAPTTSSRWETETTGDDREGSTLLEDQQLETLEYSIAAMEEACRQVVASKNARWRQLREEVRALEDSAERHRHFLADVNGLHNRVAQLRQEMEATRETEERPPWRLQQAPPPLKEFLDSSSWGASASTGLRVGPPIVPVGRQSEEVRRACPETSSPYVSRIVCQPEERSSSWGTCRSAPQASSKPPTEPPLTTAYDGVDVVNRPSTPLGQQLKAVRSRTECPEWRGSDGSSSVPPPFPIQEPRRSLSSRSELNLRSAKATSARWLTSPSRDSDGSPHEEQDDVLSVKLRAATAELRQHLAKCDGSPMHDREQLIRDLRVLRRRIEREVSSTSPHR